MGRSALRCAAVCLLPLCGFAAAVLTAAPAFGHQSTTSLSTSTSTSPTVTSPARSVVVFSGHGYGHGLGLSQWGAYGYAQHGLGYARILAHYYPGTVLGHAPPRTLRVLAASERKATVASGVPWTVTDSAGRSVRLAPGALVLTGAATIDSARQLEPPFTFTASKPLSLDGAPYRGRLVVSGDGKLVQVIDSITLEQYLRGVVPAEMPADWPAAALEAQAVAARSYALANLSKGRAFDVYGDTRSQAYGGARAETVATDAAVAATRGRVLRYGGTVANTLFFSTSGGRTASALELTGVAVPYLVPVADPYDSLSPYHDWGPVVLDAAQVAKALKAPLPLADVRALSWPSGRVRSLTLVSADESQVAVTGNEARAALGLRSTWFMPAFLALDTSARTMTYGGGVSLSGIAHGASPVSLESRTAAASWASGGPLTVRPDGTFTTIVHPEVTTQYRLAFGSVRAALVKVAVAPRIDAAAGAAGVAGSIRPALQGAVVELQQLAGTAWLTLSTTNADSTGSFGFPAPSAAGTYRIRCAPGQGLAPGFSAPLLVS